MLTPQEMLKSLNAESFTWRQIKSKKKEYELVAGKKAVGSLRFEKAYGSLVGGQIFDEVWTFKRVGFWKPYVTVRQPGTGDRDLARFRMNMCYDGALEFPDGRAYHWKQVNFWRGEWAFVDPTSGSPLVVFKQGHTFFKQSSTVTINANALSRLDLPILLLFGWYLLMMAAQDSSAVAAVVATMG